ncbi:hypothetical protein E4U42_001993 [Claviceps africana]|uniref:FHA domain-containing protein n=1 Tax=Claviceps africana TaxID=83212 RepID=A0A8K0JES3_9HYPO|nr:hypothetical protein E4U42_001993 [Claviceps africana]
MWLLESKDAFDGRRMWLRPGKTYLFGRTASEPGQLAISHSTISRKHLTVTVDSVPHGHAHNPTDRSKLTVEDLATKIGTVVNGRKIRGSKYVSNGEDLDVTMGKCPSKFRVAWFPVVFTVSFTNKELQADPLAKLRERFEQIDVKLLTDYDIQHTTHVVSRKRNTAKGLQALINGKFVVTDTFLDAITQAAEVGGDSEPSALERDFEQAWPDALQHLPPRGGEPVQHPDSVYAPEADRKDVFDGYTFIFYDNTQYSNLMAPITNGGGKAIMQAIKPGETHINDFVRCVKEAAGEKGLGSFEDGSEGKGIVLVRYLPAKGDHINWYADFITQVSLRLDHRPIEQNEFLEAILINDASILRRPLEVEPASGSQTVAGRTEASSAEHVSREQADQPIEGLPPPTKARRARRPVKRRFAGFDDDSDIDEIDEPRPASAVTQNPVAKPVPEAEECGLFVSQEQDAPEAQREDDAYESLSRKRPAPMEDDLMDGMAPAAAMFKRQRLERGDQFASPSPEPESPAAGGAPTRRPKEKMDVLAMAARHREEAEARARAEREDLANLPDNIDLAEIRRLHIVEEIEVRTGDGRARTRERDIKEGRWNPAWNGVKNFKKFRRRGEATGRQPTRTIVALQQVKTKEYGIGDSYWLEDEGRERRKSAPNSPHRPSGANTRASSLSTGGERWSSRKGAPPHAVVSEEDVDVDEDVDEDVDVDVDVDVDLDEDEVEDVFANEPVMVPDSMQRSTQRVAPAPRGTSSSSKITATPSQTTSSSRQSRSRQEKRAAPHEEASSNARAKRAKLSRQAVEVPDSDESEDELKFRFGKRR